MLWKRLSKPAPAAADDVVNTELSDPTSLPAMDPHVELENALDALAGVFRALGRHAFDLPEVDAKVTSDVCERWATHLLVRGPVPDGPWGQEDAESRAVRREFVAALHYATHLRKTEHSYITKALHDLRHAVWAFVHGLNQTFSSDGDANGRMKAQLSRLHEAASGSSTEELKREAISAAETIGHILEERRRQQQKRVASLGEEMAALGRALEEPRREVGRDALTGLCNRATFDEQLVRIADLSSLFGQAACLLVVDVDHFKSVNDALGDQAGEEVLRRLSDCLVRTFRRRNDVVARFGGDEFGVILRETELKEGLLLSERLLDSVRATSIDCSGQKVRVTVSIGMSPAKLGEGPEKWLERADRALSDAKDRGRDRVSYSVPPSDAARPTSARETHR
jgi:diguanylate cyclase (GGDEF)-like protein